MPAAYLGQADRAEGLKSQAIDYALSHTIAYAVPGIEAVVNAALDGDVPEQC